jgi:lysophospholipase L1-like esterase
MSFRVKRFPLLPAIAAMLLALWAVAGFAQATTSPRWVCAWASAQMTTEAPQLPVGATLDGSTLRQLVRVGAGGTRIRLRLSNAFGSEPLTIGAVHVARALSPQSARINPASDLQVTFDGASGVTIPAGAEYVSDPVPIGLPALSTLAVSMHLDVLPKTLTGHPGSRATSYIASGDQLAAAGLQSPARVEHWYFLTAVDVQPPTSTSAVAVLGDSITDGHGVKTDANLRWTDTLLQRLVASSRPVTVLNLGIGGNRVVTDGLGPNALARFERDIIGRNGVRWLIIFEGVNDLGMLTRDAPVTEADHQLLVDRIIRAYRQMIARAHERGIKVIGATITPYAASGYYHPAARSEADRQAINAWIGGRGHFDAVMDFDALIRDPGHPALMRKKYDSGDGLHPSDAGYRAMGEAVPLNLFEGASR